MRGKTNNKNGYMLGTAIGIVLLAGICGIGFIALVEKIRILDAGSLDDNWEPWHLRPQVFIRYVGFMNQVLGILNVDLLFEERVMEFLFARSDAVISKKEKALGIQYLSIIRRSIGSMHDATLLERFAAVVTFGSSDLQKIALSDTDNRVEDADWEVLSDEDAAVCVCMEREDGGTGATELVSQA